MWRERGGGRGAARLFLTASSAASLHHHRSPGFLEHDYYLSNAAEAGREAVLQ